MYIFFHEGVKPSPLLEGLIINAGFFEVIPPVVVMNPTEKVLLLL
jgi:hypothetical protein